MENDQGQDQEAIKQEVRSLIDLIKDWKTSTGGTNKDLAIKAGISTSLISLILSGSRKPGPGTVGKICEAMGIDQETCSDHWKNLLKKSTRIPGDLTKPGPVLGAAINNYLLENNLTYVEFSKEININTARLYHAKYRKKLPKPIILDYLNEIGILPPEFDFNKWLVPAIYDWIRENKSSISGLASTAGLSRSTLCRLVAGLHSPNQKTIEALIRVGIKKPNFT